MKKMILAIAAVFMMTAAQAQDAPQRGKNQHKKIDKTEMIKHRTDETVKKYGLNKKQAEQLLDLNTKYADKLGPRRGGPRGQRPEGRPQGRRKRPDGNRPELSDEQKAKMEAERSQAREDMKAYDAELQKIMSPDQYKVYQEDQQKQRGRRGPRGPRNPDEKES